MIKDVTIQDLMKIRVQEFGKTWVDSVSSPEKVAKMVDSLSDFHLESMKIAYEFGLKEKQELLTSNLLRK